MAEVLPEAGGRLNPVDLWTIYGEMAREMVRHMDPETDARFWPEFASLEREFKELFGNHFTDWDEWSACFNSDEGATKWWSAFQETQTYLRAQVIVDQIRDVLLANGLDPKELERSRLLRESFRLDKAWVSVLLPPKKQAEVLRRPYGWLELRLVALTLPSDLDPDEIPDPIDPDAGE